MSWEGGKNGYNEFPQGQERKERALKNKVRLKVSSVVLGKVTRCTFSMTRAKAVSSRVSPNTGVQSTIDSECTDIQHMLTKGHSLRHSISLHLDQNTRRAIVRATAKQGAKYHLISPYMEFTKCLGALVKMYRRMRDRGDSRCQTPCRYSPLLALSHAARVFAKYTKKSFWSDMEHSSSPHSVFIVCF